MAGLWTGTTINTTIAAQTFNQLFNWTAIPMVRKANGLLYAVLDKAWRDTTPTGGINFKRLNKISGNKIEVKLLGRLASPSTVADGSAELATATLLYDADTYGAVTFDLAHYAETFGVPNSEWKRIRGQEAKTKDYMKEKFEHIMLSYENVWGDAMNGTGATAPGRQFLGNWVAPASDGVSAGESSYSTYGLDRSDAGNADFRGTVKISQGNLDLASIKLLRNQIKAKGGQTRLLVGDTTVYSKIEQLVENFTYVPYREDWSKFGGQYVSYASMVAIQEHRAPSGTLGLLDPESFALWLDQENAFDEASFIKDPSRKAARVIPTDIWMQFLCIQPSRNGKITGITG